jgi:hypothetical protein
MFLVIKLKKTPFSWNKRKNHSKICVPEKFFLNLQRRRRTAAKDIIRKRLAIPHL